MALAGTRQALEASDGSFPVYTNRKVINNDPTMAELADSGLINVNNNWRKVPDGSVVIFSAHGVPPSFHEIAEQRHLLTVDLTCQLVTRVHHIAIEAEREGKYIIYAGVSGHPETVGVMGEIKPENITLVETLDDAKRVIIPEGRVAMLLSQTTLSTAELLEIFDFFSKNERVEIPNRWDICPTTDLNQKAVDELIKSYGIDFLLVQGSPDSHNTEQLRRMAEKSGIPSAKIDTTDDMQRVWFTSGIRRVGFTSGASVEDKLSEPVFEWFRREGIEPIDLMEGEKREKQFKLPEQDLQKLRERAKVTI